MPWGTALGKKFAHIVNVYFFPLTYSHYLELLNPLWTVHSLRARVDAVIQETADCVTLLLQPGHQWRRQRAGQFVRIGVDIGGSKHARTYSLSSPPQRRDGRLTITVKTVANGRVSQFLAKDLQVGAYVDIGLPQGEFMLPEVMPVKPLFITAGSGITPVMAMLREFGERDVWPDIVHINYAPDAASTIFGGELRALAERQPRYRLVQRYSRNATAADGSPGHFDPVQLDAWCPDWRQREVWVCGPQSLCQTVEAHWQASGLASRCHVERFSAALAPLPAGVSGGAVTFSATKITVAGDGKHSLLQMAEGAGMAPGHGCRMGICHSCDVVIKSGHVRDLRTGQVVACEPGQRVQICICAPAGDCELVA